MCVKQLSEQPLQITIACTHASPPRADDKSRSALGCNTVPCACQPVRLQTVDRPRCVLLLSATQHVSSIPVVLDYARQYMATVRGCSNRMKLTGSVWGSISITLCPGALPQHHPPSGSPRQSAPKPACRSPWSAARGTRRPSSSCARTQPVSTDPSTPETNIKAIFALLTSLCIYSALADTVSR